MFTKKGEDSFEWMWLSAEATSLWETLPVNNESQKSAARASHNHPMQAGYDICFYEEVAGISPDASGYGFKVIRFQPMFIENLEWAKASIESPYGTIVSDWKKRNGFFKWIISIPANSSGLVSLPEKGNIKVNGKLLDKIKFMSVINEGEITLYYFPSGEFEIIWKL